MKRYILTSLSNIFLLAARLSQRGWTKSSRTSTMRWSRAKAMVVLATRRTSKATRREEMVDGKMPNMARSLKNMRKMWEAGPFPTTRATRNFGWPVGSNPSEQTTGSYQLCYNHLHQHNHHTNPRQRHRHNYQSRIHRLPLGFSKLLNQLTNQKN